MSSYCAISPTSSAPWLRRRGGTSSAASAHKKKGRRHPAVAVRGSHHGDVGTDVVEPDGLVHPRPLDRRLAFQLHTELGEERFGSLEVLDDDEHVVHSLNHVVLLASWAVFPQMSTGRLLARE